MQISRHWRLNSQRYRLEGFRQANGDVSLQARPVSQMTSDEDIEMPETPVMVVKSAKAVPVMA
ncbi:MAG: hypothetical protein K8I30_10085 [Anaerolineae bacterium]|nr:hypothetical protein [Anaerolineae bacterium]